MGGSPIMRNLSLKRFRQSGLPGFSRSATFSSLLGPQQCCKGYVDASIEHIVRPSRIVQRPTGSTGRPWLRASSLTGEEEGGGSPCRCPATHPRPGSGCRPRQRHRPGRPGITLRTPPRWRKEGRSPDGHPQARDERRAHAAAFDRPSRRLRGKLPVSCAAEAPAVAIHEWNGCPLPALVPCAPGGPATGRACRPRSPGRDGLPAGSHRRPGPGAGALPRLPAGRLLAAALLPAPPCRTRRRMGIFPSTIGHVDENNLKEDRRARPRRGRRSGG